MNRRSLYLPVILAAQAFALAVVGAIVGGASIAWRVAVLMLLVALATTSLLAAVVHLFGRLRGAKGLSWLTASQLVAAGLITPLAYLIRPRAALNERFALLFCLLIVLFAPIAAAAWSEETRG